MRKIFLILIVLSVMISFNGCFDAENEEEKMGDAVMKEVKFIEIEQCGIDWKQIEFSIDLSTMDFWTEAKSVETRQDALMIGKTLIEKCHENNMFINYTLLSIVYSRQDDIWRFDYSIDQRHKTIEEREDCGNLYVAVQGSNGKLIKAWIEE